MSSRLRRVAVLLLAPIAACAGGAAPATNAAPQDAPAEASEGRGRVTPPRMLGSTTPPAVGQLRVRRAGAPNAPSMRRAAADRLTVEVRIDADGKPDMSSLVIRGRDAELPHVCVTRDFLNAPERYLRHLG